MQRIRWIDSAKGFAMLCVVLGHAITGTIRQNNVVLGTLYDFIYLFHMPLFFFLSGYLYQCNEKKYQSKKIGELIINKAKYLMIPYFVYSIITYLGICFGNNIPIIKNILQSGGFAIDGLGEAIRQILFWQGSMDQHLWFIYCLFLIYVFNIVILRGDSKYRGYVYILCSLLIYIVFLKTEINLLQRFSNYLIYFVVGRCCYSKRENIFEIILNKRTGWIIPLICAVLLTVVRILTIDIVFDNYVFTIIKSIYSLLTSLSLVYFLCILFHYSIPSLFRNFFDFIYKYNFEIYILHQPFIISGGVMLLTWFCGEGPLLDVSIVMSVTVIGILVCICITRIVRCSRIASKLLFGK